LAASFQGDRAVRLSLHEAASMAGMAFDQAGLGICHALAHSIGGATHVPHGRLCAILLPAVLEYNAPAVLGQYVRLARCCGLHAATDRLVFRQLIDALIRLRKTLQMPGTLLQAGITRVQWEKEKSRIMQSAMEDPCCKTNPIPVTLEGLERVCKAVYA